VEKNPTYLLEGNLWRYLNWGRGEDHWLRSSKQSLYIHTYFQNSYQGFLHNPIFTIISQFKSPSVDLSHGITRSLQSCAVKMNSEFCGAGN